MKAEKRNPRVAFAGRFDDTDITSGPVKTANRLFNEHSKGNRSSFITYFFNGKKYSFYKKLFGLELQELNGNDIYTAGLFRVYGILKKVNPEIIHILTFERFAVLILLYRLFNEVKIIYNSHGVIAYEDRELKSLPYFYKAKNRFCEKRLLKNSDVVIFPSALAIDIAEQYYGLDLSNTVILPNGIDAVFQNPNRHYVLNNVIRAVFIYNSILNQSGLDFLLRYLSGRKTDSKLELHLITDEEIIVPETTKLKIFCRTKMNAEKLAGFYLDKDVFLSLNNYDTFSISTAEAMASGLIPIITSCTGISRYIDDDYNGYLIEYGDIKGLNRYLNLLTEMNAKKRIEISREATQIYDSLSWPNVYELYRNLYLETINK